MRRTASPSRPYGRYAVGLRPSLDPDAYFDAPSQDKEARRTNQNNTDVGLDRPRSFSNDLGKSSDRRMLRGRTVGPDDIFLDVGSGKGRVLVAASRYPFARVIGIEINDGLNRVARANLESAKSKRRCGDVEVITADARDWAIPTEVNYIYL
jgi:SAM-dependent methyltransferase